MTTTHDKIVSNRYKLIKKPYQSPKLTHIAVYWKDLNRSINELSQKITPETENKYKKLMQEDVKHFQEKIFSDPQIYGLFLGDYIRRNPKIMGDFKDKLSSVSKKIGSLNFTGLTHKQITSKVSGFFEENLQDETLDLAHDVQAEFEKQRKEIIKARIKQWWRQEQLAGTANTVRSLSLSELEAYLMQSEAILNDDSIINKPENLSNQQFNNLLENAETANPVDKVQVISHDFCSFKDSLTENGDIDKEKIKAAAEVANSTGADIHLSKVFESTMSYAECPVLINYSSDELKTKVQEYLTCINENFENLSSCSYVCDIDYEFDVESYNSFLTGNISQTEHAPMVEARKRIRPSAPSKEVSQEEINETYSRILAAEAEGQQTIVEESISAELPTCVWEDKFGLQWYATMFEMGEEYLPNTTLYLSATNLDNPKKAKEVIDKCNVVRDRENELEKEHEEKTGEDIDRTLLGGLELDMSKQITTSKNPNFDVLSRVVKSMYIDGHENGGVPVRISGLEVIPEVTPNSTTQTIADAQALKYNEIGEFLVENAYNIAPGGAEFMYPDETTSYTVSVNSSENQSEDETENITIDSTIFKGQDDLSIGFDASEYLKHLEEQMEKNSKLYKKQFKLNNIEHDASQYSI